jgi:acyl transferase domain-containing protein
MFAAWMKLSSNVLLANSEAQHVIALRLAKLAQGGTRPNWKPIEWSPKRWPRRWKRQRFWRPENPPSQLYVAIALSYAQMNAASLGDPRSGEQW